VDHQKQRQGKNTSDHPPAFHSETEGLFYSLHYFQHMRSHKLDWAHTSVTDIGNMTMEGEEMTNKKMVNNTWHSVSCFFFLYGLATAEHLVETDHPTSSAEQAHFSPSILL
jgi:hypothetical protein